MTESEYNDRAYMDKKQQKNDDIVPEVSSLSLLSSHINNNVPKLDTELEEGEYTCDFDLDDSEHVVDEIYRNTQDLTLENYGDRGCSKASEKMITNCSEKLVEKLRKDTRELKKILLDREDIVGASEYFRKKMSVVEKSGVLALGITAKVKFVPYKANSRYFKEGRQNIRKKIFKKYGNEKISKDGVFLTLTYDRKEISLWDAWRNVGEHCRVFMKNLNRLRKKHFGKCENLKYFKVVESHKDNYPHVHYYFPRLRWLWHHNKDQDKASKNSWGSSRSGLLELWDWGRVNVQKCKKKGKVANYVAAYVGKMKDCSETVKILMWLTGVRLYTFSSGWGECEKGDVVEREFWYVMGSCKSKDFAKIIDRIKMRIRVENNLLSAPGAPPGDCDDCDAWNYNIRNLEEVGLLGKH